MIDWLEAFACVSAIAAATAALAALWQVRKAAQSNEASAYLQMMANYADPEMRDSVSSLSKLWRLASQDGKTVVQRYELFDKESERDIINGDCRRVSSYFVDAYRLYSAGMISKKLLKLAVYHPGLNVFYNVAVPLNEHKNTNHNSIESAKMLKEIVPIHGDGIF